MPGFKKWNLDASGIQVKCVPRTSSYKVLVLKDEINEARENGERLVVEQSTHADEMDIFIKYVLVGNADGQLTRPLIYIQVKSMPENTFYTSKVVGLSHSSEVGAYGYCIAVPNRQGNDAANSHIHKMFVIPEIALCSEAHRDDEGGDLKDQLNFDGECKFLDAAMQPSVQEAYRENDIGATKGNPSGTSKNQVLDVSPIFMCVHKAVEQANSKQKKVRNENLRRSLAKFIREVAIEFPCTKNTLSSVFVENYLLGLRH